MYTTTRGPAQFTKANVKAFQRKMQAESTHMTNSNYTAPIHAIVGAGGFSLDNFPKNVRAK
jgi:acid phosphatase type 7